MEDFVRMSHTNVALNKIKKYTTVDMKYESDIRFTIICF